MVISTHWFLSPVISRVQTPGCGLPMAGEDSGLEAVASPMEGYLGKVQERAASLDHCPWCHSKGQTHPLHSYRLSLEESITLCTNPQCLFPLVSRPLEDVLCSLVPVAPTTGNGNIPLVADEEPPSPKLSQINELDTSESQTSNSNDVHNTIDTCDEPPADEEEHEDVRLSGTKQLELRQQNVSLPHTDSDFCNGNQNVSLDTADETKNSSETLQTLTSHNRVELNATDNRVSEEDHSFTNNVTQDEDCSLPNGDVSPIKNNQSPVQTEATEAMETRSPAEEPVVLSDIEVECSEGSEEEELVPAPAEIFWRNEDKLCWLDSLLVALVNLKNLRNLKPQVELQSPMWKLLSDYDEAHATIQSRQQTDRDGSLKIPNLVLHKINSDLETLRMSVFSVLQPKLQCKLGQMETPVFALPLLVKMDSWLQPLFQSTFQWNFRCTECKSKATEKVVNTLPSFTNIVPDWHPLRAFHLAPCNNCHRKNQRRRMVLQKVPPVFALHFVEGLPDNNMQVYNFNFRKKHYSVTAVIQYSSQQHFVTWVQKCDGSWLEFDDVKHPHCKSHTTLPVPAQEIHIVFWEEEQRQESRACSPSTTVTDSPPSAKHLNPSATDLDNITNDLMQGSPDESLHNPHNGTSETTVTADVDTTIGSTTLLDAFEGLTHNDIVTLTLVEVKDAKQQPPMNSTEVEQSKDVKSQNMNSEIQDVTTEVSAPAPDSSTIEIMEKAKESDDEIITISESDDLDSDPTFEPVPKRGPKRVPKRSDGIRAKRPKVDLKLIESSLPLLCRPTPTSVSKCVSPVSSTVPTLKTAVKAPTVVQQEQKSWSHLLERSLGHEESTNKLNPKFTSQRTKTGPVHSKPVQKNAVTVKLPPKPALKMESSEGFPLKAAEMYVAFGSKSSKPDPTAVNGAKTSPEPQEALACSPLKTSTTGLFSVKRSKSATVLEGLSETEILRYKIFKKLRAKKKKLAKLNKMVTQGGDSFKPDSTNNFSPNTVSSSTLDDEFFSDLLSPATTITSTLSPDSTDFLEMLASGQEATVGAEMAANTAVKPTLEAGTPNFLDEFLSQAVAERPSEMEEDPLSALDLFL